MGVRGAICSALSHAGNKPSQERGPIVADVWRPVRVCNDDCHSEIRGSGPHDSVRSWVAPRTAPFPDVVASPRGAAEPSPSTARERESNATLPAKLGSLTEIVASRATRWVAHTASRYGKDQTLQLAGINCLWEPLGPDTPVRVILIKDDQRPGGYQIALITTDRHSTPAQIVERYADRWPIEVASEDGKELSGQVTPAIAPPAPWREPSRETPTFRAVHGAQEQQTSLVNVLRAQSGIPARAPRQTFVGPQRAPSQQRRGVNPDATRHHGRPPGQRHDPHHFHDVRMAGHGPGNFLDTWAKASRLWTATGAR